MATTTNYGWTTPDDTDLVKDGAAAIRTLGSSVDTTTKNLNPETTLGDMSFRSATSNVNTRLPIGSSGQHLTVVAGVPAWATASDQTPLTTKGDLFTFSTVDARLGVGTNDHRLVAASGEATGLKYVADTQNTVIDAAGDLVYGTAADTLGRLAIGTAGQVLKVNSGATAPEWGTAAAGGGFTELSSGSLSGTSTVVSITTTGYKQLVIYVKDVTASADYFPTLRFNGDSGSNYTLFFQYQTSSTAVATNMQTNAQEFYVDQLNSSSADNFSVFTVFDPANSTTHKNCNFWVAGRDKGDTFHQSQWGYGQWRNTAAITSVTFTGLGGVTYSTGTYEIYGVK